MKITIPFKAYSLNNYYYADRKHGKRVEAKDWEYKVNWELQKYQSEFESFRSDFNALSHSLQVTFIFNYKNFITKDGLISSKTFDLSNCEKPLLDLLLNPANNGPAPYKSPNLNIDDRLVTKLISEKRQADSDSIEIEILKLDSNSHSY